MIVYGRNVFTQIQEQADSIEFIYIQSGIKDSKIRDAVKSMNKPVKTVSRQELDKLTGTNHHQGIACQVKDIQTYALQDLVGHAKKPGLIVCLDEIQDPHNVGAVLRTCDCVGADGLILTKHNSAGLTPAAVKASTGAAYTVPVSIVTNLSSALKQLKKEGYWIIGTDMDHARDYREGIYDVPVVLVIGNEGKGISPLVKKQCDYMVKLPMVGTISSLNASVACAVVLYQIFDQRSKL